MKKDYKTPQTEVIVSSPGLPIAAGSVNDNVVDPELVGGKKGLLDEEEESSTSGFSAKDLWGEEEEE